MKRFREHYNWKWPLFLAQNHKNNKILSELYKLAKDTAEPKELVLLNFFLMHQRPTDNEVIAFLYSKRFIELSDSEILSLLNYKNYVIS